jgi:hypothetical protein
MKITYRVLLTAVIVGSLVLVGGAAAAAIGDEPTTTITDESTTTAESTTIAESTTTETPTTVEATTVPTTSAPAPETQDGAEEVEKVTSGEGQGPDPTGPAQYGLCRAFYGRTEVPGESQAYKNLWEAAGGDIDAFCEPVLAEKEARKRAEDGGHSTDPDPEDADESTAPPKDHSRPHEVSQGRGHNKHH